MQQNSGVLKAIAAAFAVGAGVMGTAAWLENRPAQKAKTQIGMPPGAAEGASPALQNVPPGASTSEAPQAPSAPPPPPSTVGLSPAASALTLGNYHYDLAQWPQAIAQYRVAITQGVDNPNVRTDLGNALRFDKQPQKALEQYAIAQKQDPRHEQSLFNQGGLYAQSLGDKSKALAAWKTYLKRFPNGQSVPQAQHFIEQFGG